jgi:MFS superfamily sulfate permease-like transporter
METGEMQAEKTKTVLQKIKIPKDGWEGLKENFGKDALSGFMVFLLALPLSLGIAGACDFPKIMGLIPAIIGGLVVSFFMGGRLTIKGAAAGLIVIAANSVAAFGGGDIGWHLTLGVIIVAGIVQILFGVLKLGKLSDFFPGAAIHGMLAAIGIIIMSKQIHFLLGIDPKILKGKEPLELLAMIPESIMSADHHVEIIGLLGLGILFGLTSFKKGFLSKIPAPLVVLILAIPLGLVFHFNETEPTFDLVKVGSIFEAFTKGFDFDGTGFFSRGLINVDFSGITNHTSTFILYVVLFSLIGTIESMLTAKAMDGKDPYKRKTNHNKDLISVGIGNTICGIFGGLPMISEVARSSANIHNGAKTRWANFFHGLFMLLALLVAVPVIEMILTQL